MLATIARPYLATFRSPILRCCSIPRGCPCGHRHAVLVSAPSWSWRSQRLRERPRGPSITLAQAITYIWLGQAFLGLLPWNVDTEIAAMMRSGNVAYERLRPVDTYFYWFARALACSARPERSLRSFLCSSPPPFCFRRWGLAIGRCGRLPASRLSRSSRFRWSPFSSCRQPLRRCSTSP